VSEKNGKGLKKFTIHLEGTDAEIQAKKDAILSGKEPLIKGRAYNAEEHLIVWETIATADPFSDRYYKASKALLDIKLREVGERELQFPLALDGELGQLSVAAAREKITVAIEGGIRAVDLNFEESRVLQAIQRAYSDEDARTGAFPREVSLTRAGLFDLMAIETKTRPDGTRYHVEGRRGQLRTKIDRVLRGLSEKHFPFVFKRQTGTDKKTGEPIYSVALTDAPLVQVALRYDDVRQAELPGLSSGRGPGQRRFSCYDIRLNPNALGDVQVYFRMLPSALAREISDYRKARGQKPSVRELLFVEYLFAESRAVIEINELKLAEKLKIKGLHDIRRVRKDLARCYELALGLGFVLSVKSRAPAIRGTKEVIRLNPDRFYRLKDRSGGRPAGA
jgi:hypothetical protein